MTRKDAHGLPTKGASRTDAELLLQWRSGCARAGRELLHRYYPALRRFFRSRARGEAQELMQRSLLACLEKRDSLRDTARFRAFLFGVARLELLRSINERRRWPDAIDPAQISLSDPRDTPSSIVAQREERRRLARALPQLPRQMQIVVALHYWERLSATEISDVIGAPVGTVKSRLRRAKALLFQELEAMSAASGSDESVPASFRTWVEALRAEPVAEGCA